VSDWEHAAVDSLLEEADAQAALVRQLRNEVARLNTELARERAAHWRCIRTIYALTMWGDQ
jgi:capsule polysaccharide export protein KpsE/RkpR